MDTAERWSVSRSRETGERGNAECHLHERGHRLTSADVQDLRRCEHGIIRRAHDFDDVAAGIDTPEGKHALLIRRHGLDDAALARVAKPHDACR